MAAGGSAPELFTSVIGVFIAKNDVGIGKNFYTFANFYIFANFYSFANFYIFTNFDIFTNFYILLIGRGVLRGCQCDTWILPQNCGGPLILKL